MSRKIKKIKIKIKKELDILDLAGKFKPKGKIINALKAREYMSKNYKRV